MDKSIDRERVIRVRNQTPGAASHTLAPSLHTTPDPAFVGASVNTHVRFLRFGKVRAGVMGGEKGGGG